MDKSCGGLPRRTNSLPAHSLGQHLAADDLIDDAPSHGDFSGEFLTAVRAAKVTSGVILEDAIWDAFDQRPSAALAVFVQFAKA